MKHFGRPFSVLTETQVAALIAEYDAKPFNVAARARALGIKSSCLSYHIRGGKVAVVVGCSTWRAALQKAYRALRANNPTDAAKWLRETARRVEKHQPFVPMNTTKPIHTGCGVAVFVEKEGV